MFLFLNSSDIDLRHCLSTCRDDRTKMPEYISIHVGNTGALIGQNCWEIYCLEHGIQPDGKLLYSLPGDKSVSFIESRDGSHIARAVFASPDEEAAESLRTSTYSQIFNPEMIIANDESGVSGFESSHLPQGSKLIEIVSDRIRNQAESCSSLQGLLLFSSLGGGNSPSFTSLLMQHLAEDYCNTPKVHFSTIPYELKPTKASPFNTILATHDTMELSDLVFLFKNTSLCKFYEKNGMLPKFKGLNRLLSRVVSSITGSLRFGGFPTVSLTDLVANLVPTPRLHYAMASYSPFVTAHMARVIQPSVDQITHSCFETGNQMLDINPLNGRYLSCCFLYGGNVMLKDVNATIANIKAQRTTKIGSWDPVLNVSINNMPLLVTDGQLAYTEKALCLLSNTTAIKDIWTRIAESFEHMLHCFGFYPHYINEGIQKEDLEHAITNIRDLCQEYEKAEFNA